MFDAPSHPGKYEERVDYLKKTIRAEKETTYAVVVGVKKCEGVEHLTKCLKQVLDLGGEVRISFYSLYEYSSFLFLLPFRLVKKLISRE